MSNVGMGPERESEAVLLLAGMLSAALPAASPTIPLRQQLWWRRTTRGGRMSSGAVAGLVLPVAFARKRQRHSVVLFLRASSSRGRPLHRPEAGRLAAQPVEWAPRQRARIQLRHARPVARVRTSRSSRGGLARPLRWPLQVASCFSVCKRIGFGFVGLAVYHAQSSVQTTVDTAAGQWR